MKSLHSCSLWTSATKSTSAQVARISSIVQNTHCSHDETLTPLDGMILTLEDRRYFCHSGFDILSIVRAFLVTCFRGNGGGASTIEQQLVRTITNRRDRTVNRKIHEIHLARKIRRRHSKIRILRVYETLAYFGEGMQGADAAAQRLFGKTSMQLNFHEAATVAACLVNPIPSKPGPGWQLRVGQRRDYALKVSRRLVRGVSCLGYRAGLGSRRLYLVSDHLAQSLRSLYGHR